MSTLNSFKEIVDGDEECLIWVFTKEDMKRLLERELSDDDWELIMNKSHHNTENADELAREVGECILSNYS
jgi:hypothetical protein